ncbi:MAG: DUF2461 domain-containing protein [Candidatus Binatia bacterium]
MNKAGEGFKGFPKDCRRFLRELAANNEREWFNANKRRYRESVLEPMCAFIEAMDGELARVSDCFVADPRPNGGSMFRIYRDIRFSRDKRPYKEHAACQFRHIAGRDAHAPGFYVHVAPDDVFFGGGIWRVPGPALVSIREAIDRDQGGWKRATRSAAFRRRFIAVSGDSLKRPPRGYDPDHPFIEDLKRKSFFAAERVEARAIEQPGFVKQVATAFVALKPMMAFLTAALGLSFSLDD